MHRTSIRKGHFCAASTDANRRPRQGFSYSEALKKAGIRWDDANLDRWLTDPDAMVPDTDMAFRLASGEERKAVIAYLKSLGN